jgi:hypothetical protein
MKSTGLAQAQGPHHTFPRIKKLDVIVLAFLQLALITEALRLV